MRDSNIKSSIVMRAAHKISKAIPSMAFGACLSHSWRMVRANIKIAAKVADGTYKVSVKTFHNIKTAFGTMASVKGIECKPATYKRDGVLLGSIKRAFKQTLNVHPWGA